MTAWTAEEKCLLETIRPVLSTREIEKLLKILGYDRTTDAIQKQSKKLGISFKDFGDPRNSGDFTEKERKALDIVISEREKYVSDLNPVVPKTPFSKGSVTLKKTEILNNMFTQLSELREQTPRRGSLLTTKLYDSEKETLCILLSDWHIGEIVKDGETGEEIYNLNIAEERIYKTPELISNALGMDRIKKIDECLILLGGDMVTGEGIFPHQEMSLEEHAAAQTLTATKGLWWLIQQMRSTFPLTRVVTTKGNHGRTAHSPEANWDNIVYQQLELLIDLDGKPDLSIKNRYGDYNTFEAKGWRGLLRHNAPAQVETAAGAARFAGWSEIHSWDLLCYGHWHHWGASSWMSKSVYRNGSLVGPDEYAEGFARSDGPCQLIFGVSDTNTCTFLHPLKY